MFLNSVVCAYVLIWGRCVGVGWVIDIRVGYIRGWLGRGIGYMCSGGSGVLLSYVSKTLIEKNNSKSFSLHSRFLCLSNAVYNYSLPLLRSNLVSVHLQLDRQHRSIQVGHVSWPPFGAALLNQRQSQSSLLYFISISSISMFGIISLSFHHFLSLSPFSLLCSSWVLTSCFPPVLTILSSV